MRANAGLLGIVIISTAVFIALIAGLFAAVLPWWLAIALFVPPIVIWAGAKWTLVSMVFSLLCAYGFIPVGILATDMTVMAFVLFMVFVYRKKLTYVMSEFKYLWISLLLLMLWSLSMLVYGYFYRGNYINYVYGESITMAYWLIMIPIILIANDLKRAHYVLYALFFLSLLLSIVAVLQSVLHIRLSFSGLSKVADLTSDEGGIGGLARSTMPGILLVMFTFALSVTKLLTDAKHKLFYSFMGLINGMAIFVNFGRSVWAVTFLILVLTSALAGKKAFVKFLLIGSVSVALIVSGILAIKPSIIMGALARVDSVQTELSGRGLSYAWRVTENHFARNVMMNNPIAGIGLGGEYRPRVVDMRVFSGQTHYIHNGYFYITLKMGLIGLALYLGHIFYIIVKSWLRQRESGVDRVPQLTLLTVYLGTFILNVTQPEFMQGPSIASLASIAAAVIALGHWQSKPPPITT